MSKQLKQPIQVVPKRDTNEWGYEPHEDFIIIDDDIDLTPDGQGVRIDILDLIQRTYVSFGKTPPTKFPEFEKIFNYGLPPEEQVFRKQVIPPRIISLTKHIREKEKTNKYGGREQTSIRIELNTINKFWETLEEKHEEYKEEIEWIERMWYFRLFGAWYFLNGRPYYMTGKMFFYVNFSEIPKASEGIQYRDRDRRFYIAAQWAKTETRTFVNTDKDGIAIPNDDGTYEMKDLGKRVFYGIISAKPRRVGDSSKSVSASLESATRSIEEHYGLQGESEDTSEALFNNHLMFQFKKYPIFFKPLTSTIKSTTKLEFISDDPDVSLNTWFDYASSKHGAAYDGRGLADYIGDEVGKVKDVDITFRHKTIKLCCSERDVIDGNINYQSTVEQMDKESGMNYLKLCKSSKYHQRLDNGQTQTGMISVYFRASDGHPTFIDPYGFSVEKKILPYQAEWLKKQGLNPKIGAYQYLLNNRKGLTEEDLSQEKRQNPLSYREIFTPPANNNFLPINKIEKRLSELRFGKSRTRRGNLAWTNGLGSKVVWIDSDSGRFVTCMMPELNEQNRWIKYDGKLIPENPNKYIASADTFRLNSTDSGRMSNGGFSLRYKRDFDLDPDTKPAENWVSAKQIVYYSYRPDTVNEFCEDTLKACIFWGAMMYPENNVDNVNQYYINNGYEGYLLYDVDENNLKKKNAGFSMTHSKVKGFNEIRDDLSVNVGRHDIEELLSEAMAILGLNDLTNFDGLTAYMGTLLGERSVYAEQIAKMMNIRYDVSGFFIERNY